MLLNAISGYSPAPSLQSYNMLMTVFNPELIAVCALIFFIMLPQIFEERKIRSYAAHLLGKNSYDGESYFGGTAFFIGNEGNGLTDVAAEAADCLIRIPMCGKVESLNAAMASGILMYEAARQRRG